MGTSVENLLTAAPGILRWLDHVFNVMGGFMVATGALTLLVACRDLASRASETFAAMAFGQCNQRPADERNQFHVAFGFSLVAAGAYRAMGRRAGLLPAGGGLRAGGRPPSGL